MHGIRLDPQPLEEHRGLWLDRGTPTEQIDRMIAFEERWGGFALAPAPAYEGGPRLFGADSPEGSPEEGWWFSAGDQRCSVPFSYWIGPDDQRGAVVPGGRTTLPRRKGVPSTCQIYLRQAVPRR
ncbi:MAG TPA: hypothetical protein VFU65_21770 [Actinocrinis sp.]|nr:hypothetical protein [Actinocrinis sp.]